MPEKLPTAYPPEPQPELGIHNLEEKLTEMDNAQAKVEAEQTNLNTADDKARKAENLINTTPAYELNDKRSHNLAGESQEPSFSRQERENLINDPEERINYYTQELKKAKEFSQSLEIDREPVEAKLAELKAEEQAIEAQLEAAKKRQAKALRSMRSRIGGVASQLSRTNKQITAMETVFTPIDEKLQKQYDELISKRSSQQDNLENARTAYGEAKDGEHPAISNIEKEEIAPLKERLDALRNGTAVENLVELFEIATGENDHNPQNLEKLENYMEIYEGEHNELRQRQTVERAGFMQKLAEKLSKRVLALSATAVVALGSMAAFHFESSNRVQKIPSSPSIVHRFSPQVDSAGTTDDWQIPSRDQLTKPAVTSPAPKIEPPLITPKEATEEAALTNTNQTETVGHRDVDDDSVPVKVTNNTETLTPTTNVGERPLVERTIFQNDPELHDITITDIVRAGRSVGLSTEVLQEMLHNRDAMDDLRIQLKTNRQNVKPEFGSKDATFINNIKDPVAAAILETCQRQFPDKTPEAGEGRGGAL